MKKALLNAVLSVITFCSVNAQSIYLSSIQTKITSLKEDTRALLIKSLQEENRALKSGRRSVPTYKYVIGECKPQLKQAFSVYDNIQDLANSNKYDEYQLKKILQALEQISYVSHKYYSGSREIKIHLRSGRVLAIYSLYGYAKSYE
jgi:DNA repair ATPase RecN